MAVFPGQKKIGGNTEVTVGWSRARKKPWVDVILDSILQRTVRPRDIVYCDHQLWLSFPFSTIERFMLVLFGEPSGWEAFGGQCWGWCKWSHFSLKQNVEWSLIPVRDKHTRSRTREIRRKRDAGVALKIVFQCNLRVACPRSLARRLYFARLHIFPRNSRLLVV